MNVETMDISHLTEKQIDRILNRIGAINVHLVTDWENVKTLIFNYAGHNYGIKEEILYSTAPKTQYLWVFKQFK